MISGIDIGGEIPSFLSNCNQTLKILYLYENNFEGTIPESFGSFTKLKTFNVRSNKLHGDIDVFMNFPDIEAIVMENNNFNGTIPNNIGDLSKLIYLGLFKNQIRGTIPNSIGNLQSLRGMYVDCLSFNHRSFY